MLKEKPAVKTRTKRVDIPTLGGVRYTSLSSDDYRDLLSRPAAESAPAPLYIRAIDIVSGPFLMEDDDGARVYDLLKEGLLRNRKVVLSMSGLKILGWFCTETVGRLYRELPRELVEPNLKVVDMNGAGEVHLRDAIRMGLLYRYDRPMHDKFIEIHERTIEEYT
jgi:hypothetical protein